MENKLNVPKLEYKTGEPMWVHWDNRYVLRGGHILGKCPDNHSGLLGIYGRQIHNIGKRY